MGDVEPAAEPRRRSFAARGGGWILTLTLWLAAAAVLIALAAAVVPRALGGQALVVESGSMEPTIKTGSLVIAAPTPASQIRTGDVPLVPWEGGKMVLHRVISVEQAGAATLVRTKGDANAKPDPDPHPLPNQVLTEKAAIPYAGYLVAALSTKVGWLLMVGLPAVILCSILLWSIWAPILREGDDSFGGGGPEPQGA
jgi:signal peptidase